MDDVIRSMHALSLKTGKKLLLRPFKERKGKRRQQSRPIQALFNPRVYLHAMPFSLAAWKLNAPYLKALHNARMEETIEAETKLLSRMELEAVAQAAMREGLSPEQVAYEQWVDTQPIEDMVAWDDMGEKGRREWIEKNMEKDGKEVLVVCDEGARTEKYMSEEVMVVSDERASVEHGKLLLTSSGMFVP